MTRKTLLSAVIIGLVVGLAAAGAVLWYSSWKLTAAGEYNAIFLANGQTYFGQIIRQTDDVVVLTKVYYLRPTEKAEKDTLKDGSQSVELVRLGGELHRPTNSMIINRDHILFTEVLASDSPISKQIKLEQ